MLYRLFILVALIALACAPDIQRDAAREKADHSTWDDLLKKHVAPDGSVDYPGFVSDSSALNAYLSHLSERYPGSNWTTNERLAYWINAYNAFTVKLIVDHYPVESIKDIRRGIPFINSVWDKRFVRIGGEKISLNNIEHGILRKEFNEPRIHFAINCASVSCPKLRNEAYIANVLDEQLTSQARHFLADESKNRISEESIAISKIFKWFQGDFTEEQDLITFLNQYAPVRISETAEVEYLEYNWELND